jgi:exopolysaccharide production protein ExoQ
LGVTLFRQDLAVDVAFFVGEYSVLLLVALLGMALLARSMRAAEVLAIATWVYAAMIVTILIFQRDQILNALIPAGANQWKMRAQPFELHPNLVGFIFGGGVFLLSRRAFIGEPAGRVICGGLGLLSLAVILASSSRAPLIAIISTLAILMPFYLPRTRATFKFLTALGALLLVFLIFKEWNTLSSYFTGVLELDSRRRGFGSGATGRFDRWADGSAAIQQNVRQFMFGGGLRASSRDIIGFSTEDSYITIILDSGVICGGLIISSMLAATVRLWRCARTTSGFPLNAITALATLIYAMVQSIFNRYLLAIGNPLSLILMLLFIQASIARVRDSRAHVRAINQAQSHRVKVSRAHQPKPLSQ